MTQLRDDLAPLPRKTAILAAGQLLQFQAKRVVGDATGFQAFSDRDKAIAWLIRNDEAR